MQTVSPEKFIDTYFHPNAPKRALALFAEEMRGNTATFRDVNLEVGQARLDGWVKHITWMNAWPREDTVTCDFDALLAYIDVAYGTMETTA